MMRYVRTIDKTVETATPRGVTPCSSDPKVEERIRVFTLTLKFLPVGRIPQQNPLTLSFLGSDYNIVFYASKRELPVVAYNSSFPLGMPCIRADSFTCSTDIVSNYGI